MPQYEARYVINALLFDAGDFMPDPEPHNRSYIFTAENDAAASKIALDYRPTVGKEFFGPAVSLVSLAEKRGVAVSDKPKSSMKAKRLRFNEQLETLVDEKGVKYEGRRFRTISAGSTPEGCHSYDSAERDALSELEDAVIKNGADAYEVISTHQEDTRQEYDAFPFSIKVTALLYKSQ